MIALLGSTGSGKTTLVNLLPRFYDYNCGSLKLDGIELKRYPRRYLRSNARMFLHHHHHHKRNVNTE